MFKLYTWTFCGFNQTAQLAHIRRNNCFIEENKLNVEYEKAY